MNSLQQIQKVQSKTKKNISQAFHRCFENKQENFNNKIIEDEFRNNNKWHNFCISTFLQQRGIGVIVKKNRAITLHCCLKIQLQPQKKEN